MYSIWQVFPSSWMLLSLTLVVWHFGASLDQAFAKWISSSRIQQHRGTAHSHCPLRLPLFWIQLVHPKALHYTGCQSMGSKIIFCCSPSQTGAWKAACKLEKYNSCIWPTLEGAQPGRCSRPTVQWQFPYRFFVRSSQATRSNTVVKCQLLPKTLTV